MGEIGLMICIAVLDLKSEEKKKSLVRIQVGRSFLTVTHANRFPASQYYCGSCFRSISSLVSENLSPLDLISDRRIPTSCLCLSNALATCCVVGESMGII